MSASAYGSGSAAGWHAHTLDAPGKFLAVAPGLDTPRRARAYQLTDEHVQATASRFDDHRPSLHAAGGASVAHRGAPDPEAALWAALIDAPAGGVSADDLKTATGMGRTWIYQRLRRLANTGQATQLGAGRWRANKP